MEILIVISALEKEAHHPLPLRKKLVGSSSRTNTAGQHALSQMTQTNLYLKNPNPSSFYSFYSFLCLTGSNVSSQLKVRVRNVHLPWRHSRLLCQLF